MFVYINIYIIPSLEFSLHIERCVNTIDHVRLKHAIGKEAYGTDRMGLQRLLKKCCSFCNGYGLY